MVQQFRDFEYDMTHTSNLETITYTQMHHTYDLALASHNGYLGQIAVLKQALSGRT